MSAFLEQLAQRSSPVQPYFEQAHTFHERRLWHQLTETLVQLYAHAHYASTENAPQLAELFAAVVQPIQAKLAPLRVAQFAVRAAAATADAAAADALLTQQLELAGDDHEAKSLLLSAQAQRALARDDVKACQAALKLSLAEIQSVASVDNAVHAVYFQTLSELHKKRSEAKEFYEASLRYLAYEPLEALSDGTQTQLASDMALAALAGDDIYNFGELLAHPIFERVRDSWLGALLTAVNIGDIGAYERVLTDNAAAIAAHGALADAQQTLREKVSILALMSLALGRAARERTLSFADIAAAARLPLDEVELLLMKALSLGLVRGAIDQVASTVAISWVQPRVLDASQLDVVARRLDDWSALVGSQLAALEKQIPAGAFH
eukprot:TRINITY_DN4047_c0_g1_i1.p1 TRINITY_DN4047_c0_g1~~TRINITY_DN4047_c0_g1_i1.p1  ORF type:complete len:380 (+),score=234.66 TRINITY_DN4047_c0_g1_i1:98-1237(+)